MIEDKLFKEIVTNEIATAKNRIGEWEAKFKKDPAYAIQWSSGVFEAAAVLEVYGLALKAFTANEDLKSLSHYALDSILRSTKYPSTSTSPQADLLHTRMIAAWTKIYDLINDPLR